MKVLTAAFTKAHPSVRTVALWITPFMFLMGTGYAYGFGIAMFFADTELERMTDLVLATTGALLMMASLYIRLGFLLEVRGCNHRKGRFLWGTK